MIDSIETIKSEQEKHRELLLHVNALLAIPSGQEFIKYLFHSLGVLELPYEFCKGEELIERLAIHRAGLSIFKLISQANPTMAGHIVAQLEKDRQNEETISNSQLENGQRASK